MSIPFIDLKTQYNALKTDINERMNAVLDHGQFILGPEVKELEKTLAEYTGSKHMIACSSGTDGGLLTLMALNIKPGDEVITTAFSFIATAEVIVLLGGKPILVDIDPETYNIDTNKIEAAITDKTKAIIPVSLYGQPSNMDEINAIAEAKNLTVIEDAAQSFGATYKGNHSCNLSKMSYTSFFPAKPLGCYGDGGAVFTSDDELAQKMRTLLVHGSGKRYYHTEIGINGRMDTLQCAVLLAKFPRFQWEVKQRDVIASRYTELLKDVSGLRTPIVHNDRTSVWAQYTIEVDNRDDVRNKLSDLKIPTAVHYPLTMADQPAYKELCSFTDISNARKAAERVMSIPMHPEMDENTQDQIVEGIKKALS